MSVSKTPTLHMRQTMIRTIIGFFSDVRLCRLLDRTGCDTFPMKRSDKKWILIRVLVTEMMHSTGMVCLIHIAVEKYIEFLINNIILCSCTAIIILI
jgi:hypothetical protein